MESLDSVMFSCVNIECVLFELISFEGLSQMEKDVASRHVILKYSILLFRNFLLHELSSYISYIENEIFSFVLVYKPYTRLMPGF